MAERAKSMLRSTSVVITTIGACGWNGDVPGQQAHPVRRRSAADSSANFWLERALIGVV